MSHQISRRRSSRYLLPPWWVWRKCVLTQVTHRSLPPCDSCKLWAKKKKSHLLPLCLPSLSLLSSFSPPTPPSPFFSIIQVIHSDFPASHADFIPQTDYILGSGVLVIGDDLYTLVLCVQHWTGHLRRGGVVVAQVGLCGT